MIVTVWILTPVTIQCQWLRILAWRDSHFLAGLFVLRAIHAVLSMGNLPMVGARTFRS
jgi:hypothetical protein